MKPSRSRKWVSNWPSKLYNPDKKDFAPRVSIAWDVTGKGKTVIRTG